MNLCPPNIWAAARALAAYLTEHGAMHVVIGTAALAAQGVVVDVPDLDVLTASEPLSLPGSELGFSEWGHDPDASGRLSGSFAGVKVDIIPAGEIAAEHWMAEPPVVVDGVNVATAAVVIGIKADASRPKDLAHFEQFRALGLPVPPPPPVVRFRGRPEQECF